MPYAKKDGKSSDKYENKGTSSKKPRRKVCRFCAEKAEHIDYKDFQKLRGFITERGKILPRRMTGCCAKHQRELTVAVKRARHVALLPFTAD